MQVQEQKQQKNSPLRSLNDKGLTDQRCILTYYYIRGLCQPIRNLFYFLNIDFIDRRLDKNTIETLQLDKLQSTFNSGLPSLKDGQLMICDSVAISFYLCQKYNAKQLFGKNLKIKSKINEVLFKYWMQKKKIMPEIAQIIKKTTGHYEAEKGVLVRELLTKLTNQTRFINFCIKRHQQTNGWILQQLTLIDFYFYETCFYITGFFQCYIEADEKLSYFISFAKKFQELEFHRKVDSRKTRLFFNFKNQSLKQIVISAWQGDEEQQIV